VAGANGYLPIGPIPRGMPINLIANLEPDPSQLVPLALKLSAALLTTRARGLSPEASATELLKAAPELLDANKCPDFIEDEGHYFGTNLSDTDKQALIEFIKTF
jgi:hypothetical protein